MATQLSPEARRVFRQYLEGRLSNAELEDWLAGAEYDSELSQEERDSLAIVRLSVIDFEEGRSQPSSIVEAVAALLASVQPEEPITVLRTDARTMPYRLEPVGI